jgi:hypothetical protein
MAELTSRVCVTATINHRDPGRVPLDIVGVAGRASSCYWSGPRPRKLNDAQSEERSEGNGQQWTPWTGPVRNV